MSWWIAPYRISVWRACFELLAQQGHTGAKPIGATNIHDALEAGFKLAQSGKGAPILDTIYFLTDGKPTAGKFQDPNRILKRVREWNSTANLKLHVIGIGNTLDEEMCEKLATIGDGQFEWRGGKNKRKGADKK